MIKFAFIVNEEDTADLKHPAEYESWIDYWSKNNDDKTPVRCANICCVRKDLVGAHVRKATGRVMDTIPTYIIPLCNKCNKSKQWLLVYTDFILAPPAN